MSKERMKSLDFALWLGLAGVCMVGMVTAEDA